MVDLAEIQAIYYMVAATGVLIAAAYYVMNIRNAERDRRRQMILQKLPAMSKEYYEDGLTLGWLEFKTPEEYLEKYKNNLEIESKLWNILNIYNTLGIFHQEGLMSLDDVEKLYTPFWAILMYEKFEFFIHRSRNVGWGTGANPVLMVPYERLYKALKRRYPSIGRKVDEASTG